MYYCVCYLIADCDILCPLEKFQQIMRSSIPKNSDLECGRTAPLATPQPSSITSGVYLINPFSSSPNF